MIDTTKYDYWLWPDFFSNDELYDFKNHLKLVEMVDEPSGDAAPGKKFTSSFNFSFNQISNLDVMKRLKKRISFVNEYHFGYDIFDYNDLDTVLLNKYSGESKHHYDWHIDINENLIFDYKFTVIANISDNYTGGEFQLNCYGNPMTIDNFKSGSVLMFRSNIQHKVNPVLSGSRETLTFFIRGPRWK